MEAAIKDFDMLVISLVVLLAANFLTLLLVLMGRRQDYKAQHRRERQPHAADHRIDTQRDG